MTRTVKHWICQLALAAALCTWSVAASAQVPIPGTDTPTLHGGTPINGMAIHGEVGFAALRAGFYTGSSDFDFGVQLSLPTFARGTDDLPSYGQTIGMDARMPFRFLIARWAKANGSFVVGPYFHVGKGCDRRYRGDCEYRTLGIGPFFGFVTDIALPKIFKLIVGIEQQLGLINGKPRGGDGNNEFNGMTYLDLGLEAFWRDMFFTTLINVGAKYGSNELWYNRHALYRHMFGFGYKFR